jgi:hypothetical protein
MKSRITIEVDFDNGNEPYLQILRADSDDVRDRLVSYFTQQFGGSSSWCRIRWVGDALRIDPDDKSNYTRIQITPVKPAELKEQAKIMMEQAELDEQAQRKYAQVPTN